ncbi:hypothetical protein AWB96_19990 [Mycobacteroides chelonae]|nr:hypothetical protein AWB96_19990 [Mycobacteroides chelonae]
MAGMVAGTASPGHITMKPTKMTATSISAGPAMAPRANVPAMMKVSQAMANRYVGMVNVSRRPRPPQLRLFLRRRLLGGRRPEMIAVCARLPRQGIQRW